ncbi:hypothetical protein [Notoacmeibacter ruber]|uniref:Uncharacterized protein n=1 Tax=Notoacmeibacter ruber TaxID=2670375 RepID=A0A3L7J8Z5_9HYPH|nr:hypothetical protein [Notoacmeibacter ruber]RLQ87096.1 hypothetical protein D8780_01575 [Notoacmeibacter ruber]
MKTEPTAKAMADLLDEAQRMADRLYDADPAFAGAYDNGRFEPLECLGFSTAQLRTMQRA